MIEQAKAKIREVKDFPIPGIGFKDITPLIEDPKLFHFVVERMAEWASDLKPDIIAGIESRGFIFGAPVAHELKLGMAMIRKKGKLPYKTVEMEAPNEYAVESFEMHVDCICKDQRVVVIDDLIATGSSSVSAINLVKKLEGRVVGFGALVDLVFLNGIASIRQSHPDVDVKTFISFDD
ncbi:adenine phosphoribosyltransferase [Acidobacteriota bacterium]